MAVRLDNADSYHPKLHLELTHDFLAAYGEDKCQPAVLVRLPPAIFIDPNDFTSNSLLSSSPQSQIASLRYLNSTHPSHRSYNFNQVDLESGVGYSNPTNEQRDLYMLHRGKSFADSGKKKNNYIVTTMRNTFNAHQDVNRDAKRTLARETRTVLISLKKENQSQTRIFGSKEEDFDELTGLRVSPVEASVALDIPLHLRYVAPLVADVTLKSTLLGGSYEAVHLEKPDLLLMCTRLTSNLPSDIYEQITTSDFLPSPHSHLSLQLTPHQDQWSFHRLKIEAQYTPFELEIPAGNASLAAFVELVTFASLILAALSIFTQTHSAMSKVHPSQAYHGKKRA